MGAAPNFLLSDRTVGSKLLGVNELSSGMSRIVLRDHVTDAVNKIIQFLVVSSFREKLDACSTLIV